MTFSPFLNVIISFIMVLLAMAFFTLLERKVLGYSQIRKGPNKVGIMGLPQPLADALKLLSKEQSKPSLSNLLPFLFTPVMSLFLALFLWFLLPSSFPTHFFSFGVMFFLCISSLNVYTTLIAGWSSNSKYALLGALRSIAQTISYEVSMALILLGALFLLLSFDMNNIFLSNSSWIIILLFPSFLTWFATTLAETNRTPFDFAEGESELVSGFNTEYSAGTFTLIFMAEYTNIIFMSMLTAILFCGAIQAPILNNMFFLVKTTFIAFLFLWIRASFPRMRYDRLMALTWKSFLPFSLGVLMMVSPISLYL
uniref:NADH-ubiquinone oxidoreductase chain 1 n=1 Tax=Eunoe nodosa TaxID=862926 RepID=A0A8B6QMG2_9ANNE|nr:NADH dehydrogenase subunit 1 [Eunoe nodosa]QTJ29905.1 NADH dehydrogenase subunit 1 [Eunoe nodosa]